nr:AlNc14C437G11635 [Albugo laibachii Nc14]|eukprot:CCA26970.1 AlNc14C437G11635 [Albugo laibachii Nc14]
MIIRGSFKQKSSNLNVDATKNHRFICVYEGQCLLHIYHEVMLGLHNIKKLEKLDIARQLVENCTLPYDGDRTYQD